MPITINANHEFALHIIRFFGQIAFSEVEALGRTHAQNTDWAGADTIHLIADDCDLSLLTHEQLDAMRTHYRTVQEGIEFFLMRRSGWVCANPDACRVVEYWLRGRHSRDGQGTEVYLAGTLSGLNELFSADEIAAVEGPQGFTELLRIHHG